jgi:acyl-CoA carboxylase epsilon subunit
MSDAVLRVVRGEPTAEELAVVTALVTAAGTSAPDEPAPALRGRWSDPAHSTRQPVRPGPGAWRAALR